MEFVLQVLANVAVLLLMAVQLAMLGRAILSIFPVEPGRFVDFLYGITEPFIEPIRRLFVKKNWFQDTWLDVPFLVADLLIWAVLMLLML